MAGLLILSVDCCFACAYDTGVHLLPVSATKPSMCAIPIAIGSICCSIVIYSKFSVMRCVFDGVSNSVVCVTESSMPIPTRCCSRLRAHQFCVSSDERSSDPPEIYPSGVVGVSWPYRPIEAVLNG